MNKNSLLKNKKDLLPVSLCFAAPFLITCISYIILGLYPFGEGQLLAFDEWHQYYPFFVSFREKLLDGSSLQYTWDVGMGTGYLSLFAYYVASPLNLFSVFVPESLLREYFALISILKISFAGLFFGMFLRTTFRKVDYALPVFALMYALCSWVGGYAWNVIWLDVFALLPLLIAGTIRLLREGRFRLYVIALGLSLWCNYYIAYFCCLFVLLCFIGYCALRWKGLKNFGLRFLRIGICTLLGVGLAAVLLLPTLYAMKATVSASGSDFHLLSMETMIEGAYGSVGAKGIWELLKTETFPGFLKGIRLVLSNLLPATTINNFEETVPNVFTSLSAVVLALYGLFNKKIPLKNKICHLLLLSFLTISFIFRILDYIWHGFHLPNMLYFRFSFLFSFVLATAAYESYLHLRHANKKTLWIVISLAALLLVNYYFIAEPVSLKVLLISGGVLLGMLGVLILYQKRKLLRTLSVIGLCVLISGEMILCWGLAVKKTGVSSRNSYPLDEAYVDVLLDHVKETDPEPFWRLEVTSTQTLNDGALNDYRGVSIFTSSANVNFNRFSHSLGISAWPGSNRYSYYEAMPFTNTMCGIKYLLDREGKHCNTDYNRLVASSGDVKLLENEAYIAPGFMTDSRLQDYVVPQGSRNVIARQNEMFQKATGQENPLYEHISHSDIIRPEGGIMYANGDIFSYNTEELQKKGEFRVVYDIWEDGLYCATASYAAGINDILVYRNGEYLFSRNIKARSLFTLGTLHKGDKLELVMKIEAGKQSTITIQAAQMDYATFDYGMETLKDEPWVVTEFTDTRISGTIEVLEDGYFYTSVPYEPGWRAFVDGQEVKLAETYDPKENAVKISDAVISFPLDAGSHSITLEYTAPGLHLGAAISITCLVIFAALSILLRKKPLLLPDRHALEEYDFLPPEEIDWEDEIDSEEEITTEEEAFFSLEEFDYESVLAEFSSQDGESTFQPPSVQVQEFTDPLSPSHIPLAEEMEISSEEEQ